MKLTLYSIAAFISVSALFSCAAKDNNDYIDKSLITPESEKRAASAAAGETKNTSPNTPAIPGITNVNPGMQVSPVSLAPQNTAAQATTITAPGMNPPHGQPGHRCDIAVGAPLNSKPATTNPQPATTGTPSSNYTIKEVPNTQKTAPGMNPPHGEPGHRCDIAVGAPLNSKPAATNTQTTAANINASPVTVTQQPAQQNTPPGMNPPHGQPNHRCDIAVGAPLNSKPAAPAAAPVQTATPPALLTPAKSDTTKN